MRKNLRRKYDSKKINRYKKHNKRTQKGKGLYNRGRKKCNAKYKYGPFYKTSSTVQSQNRFLRKFLITNYTLDLCNPQFLKALVLV